MRVSYSSELPQLEAEGPVGLDTETTGLSPRQHQVVVVSIATRDTVTVVDVRSHDAQRVKTWLQTVVFPRGVVVHNGIFDLVFLDVVYGCGYPDWFWDTKLVEQLLQAEDATLAGAAKRYLGLTLDKQWQTSFDGSDLSQEQVAYAGLDAAVLLPIMERQRVLVDRYQLRRVVTLEHLAARGFFALQRNGIGVDLDIVAELRGTWEAERGAVATVLEDALTKRVYQLRVAKQEAALAKLAEWEERLEEYLAEQSRFWDAAQADPVLRSRGAQEWVGLQLGKRPVSEDEYASWFATPAGRDKFLKRCGQRFRQEHPRPPVPKVNLDAVINLGSPEQLGAALADLFAERGLDPLPDTQSRTLKAALGLDSVTDDVIRGILRWRELEKLVQFAEQILEHTEEGRIYPDWQQIGAATGRASCRNPNLMAQPKKAGFRRAFAAKPGHVLLSCDYSQIELRIAAALSGDREMQRAFREGRDLHALTASRIFGVPEEAVTEQQRKVAKQVNFGTLYGMGPRRLVTELAAQGIRISLEEARRALDTWRETYQQAAAFLADCGEQALRCGYAVTATGRRRWFREEDEAAIRRQAGNHPIQGTAADCMKLAMARLWHLAPVAQVHDELVLEVPAAAAEEIAARVQEEMVCAASEILGDQVPILVDAAWGHSWE